MATLYKTIITLFVTVFISCNSQQSSSQIPLIPKDLTSEAEKNNTLIAFVGEKIEFSEIVNKEPSFDAGYNAKYKIIQRVYGNYSRNTIDFAAFSHKGIPEFPNYDHVLLFVSEINGKYYHEKYQYYDLYPTLDGKWAGVYNHITSYDAPPPTKKILFAKDVSFPINIINNDSDMVQQLYSQPYFKIIKNKAYPLYGYSVEELFTIKKNGVLKWRGLFGKGKENWADSILETKMADIKMDSIK
jgi:hypothetical protein